MPTSREDPEGARRQREALPPEPSDPWDFTVVIWGLPILVFLLGVVLVRLLVQP